jgi:hypothetical protein
MTNIILTVQIQVETDLQVRAEVCRGVHAGLQPHQDSAEMAYVLPSRLLVRLQLSADVRVSTHAQQIYQRQRHQRLCMHICRALQHSAKH